MSYPYPRKKNWIKVALLGGAAWREKSGETPISDLNGTLRALRAVTGHIALTTHKRAPYCAEHNCSCSRNFPRWWEQVCALYSQKEQTSSMTYTQHGEW